MQTSFAVGQVPNFAINESITKSAVIVQVPVGALNVNSSAMFSQPPVGFESFFTLIGCSHRNVDPWNLYSQTIVSSPKENSTFFVMSSTTSPFVLYSITCLSDFLVTVGSIILPEHKSFTTGTGSTIKSSHLILQSVPVRILLIAGKFLQSTGKVFTSPT